MRETALALMPQAAAISAAVQRVLSPGGGLEVNATTRSATSGPSGAMREGRVLSRSKPSTPSCMNRSCQRQTQVLDLRVRRMISLVPRPSAESSTTSARQTCFCGALRSFKITFSRLRSEGFNVMDIPVRMRQTRTSGAAWESQMGFKCRTGTTRVKCRPDGPEVRHPLCPRKQTQDGHLAMSVSCHVQTITAFHLAGFQAIQKLLSLRP